MDLAGAGSQARSGTSREFRDDDRASDCGGAPCGEQRPVNRTDVFRAEHVGEKSRYRSESASVHAEDREESDFKDHPFAAVRQARDQQKETELREKENGVGIAPANVVRKRGPEESASGVEQADERDHGGGSDRRF